MCVCVSADHCPGSGSRVVVEGVRSRGFEVGVEGFQAFRLRGFTLNPKP